MIARWHDRRTQCDTTIIRRHVQKRAAAAGHSPSLVAKQRRGPEIIGRRTMRRVETADRVGTKVLTQSRGRMAAMRNMATACVLRDRLRIAGAKNGVS